MRTVRTLGVAIVLVAMAAPVVAQTDTDLCLRVQAAPDVDLSDAVAVQNAIANGVIQVTGVIACEGPAAPAGSAAPVPDTGAWIVGPIEVDPVTDRRQAFLHLDAESGTTRAGRPIELWIACQGGSTELGVVWGWMLGSDSLIEVDTRVGDGAITTEPWLRSTSGSSTSYGGADTALIESLFGETRLAHRVRLEDGSLITAAFDITGIEKAVANVRETCGW
jgi:hypothetical protein